ncbi:poly-gamma-glutamate hydrolase family protein [Bacillus subtilis]|uniref:poly-gamma-glutamate hydrolase family protein n=1 Tax=Bacillus subtilis TaxID=1423 RepID=UPI002FFF28B6
MALKTIRKKILVGGFDRKIAQKLTKKLESTGFSAGLTEKKGCLAGEHKKRKDKSFGISPLLFFLFHKSLPLEHKFSSYRARYGMCAILNLLGG